MVDRLVADKESKTRLSQSIQKSLQSGKGLMFVLETESNHLMQYSKQLMCVETGLSYEEPSPNSFSFNSPYGYCPCCKGLGNIYAVNMKEVLPDLSKSIADGGIAPLGEERDAWTFKLAMAAAKKHKVPTNKAIKDIPVEALNILLYGNKEGIISYENAEASPVPNEEYEGVVNMILRWFNETTSDSIYGVKHLSRMQGRKTP